MEGQEKTSRCVRLSKVTDQKVEFRSMEFWDVNREGRAPLSDDFI